MESSFAFQEITPEGLRSREEMSARETLFAQCVTERILSDVESSMLDADFTESDIVAFKESLYQFSEDQIKQILSVPWELRERRFAAFKKVGKDPSQIAQDLLEDAEKNGFTIGYHLSSHEIDPISGRNASEEWCIDESELDDRDDRMMAYYSLDYENLFRKKSGKYLYIVRAHTGKETSHKQDGNNHWGRASKLSIVSKLDIADIDDDVERRFTQDQSQKKKPPTN